MEKKFEKNTFAKRLKSMLNVDFRRMFTMRFFYIMAGISLVVPILILVMTTMMDGSITVDPNTGKETVMEGFKYVWQAIGSLSSSGGAMQMDLTGMCNINLIYFAVAVLVCLFVADDFRSGYTKNLFAVRSDKTDYVISKILVGFVGGALMLIAFFVGAMVGGAIAGLPFTMEGVNAGSIIMCLLSKVFLMLVFVSIFVVMSIVSKQRSWLSMILSFGVGMLMFMMIPIITPLDATFINVILCLAGGAVFAVSLGAISRIILKKKDIL